MRLHHAFRAMGSPCSLALDGDDDAQLRAAAQAVHAEVLRLEAKYSRYRADSLTQRINATAGKTGIDVDDETAALLDYAEVAWRESGGLFDPTSGVLRRAWDFRTQRLPTQAEIARLLPLVGWHRVCWQRPHLRLPQAGMELDFGGWVKEYAADSAAARARALGIDHGYIELGGDIRVLGPQQDGTPWRIGLRDPYRPHTALVRVELIGGAVATSGDYERCIVVNGRRYGHILDPRSGWPVEHTFTAVSVIAPQTLVAGTATTTAMLLGADAGARWLKALGLPHLCVHADGRLSGPLAP
ncbi:thiamine biosynthesis lipoprotein [Fontimonas thermophila]|uniref:FAD:protein FMN transferase n=1 Tax=Fontimonas thermophila TaxID=1076937 RepID=A0A1I2JDG9_9GAMM|nr:FAD:protein FMN transferase [Fontimonas thermophila]SFF52875.1 thiamine biosynthesis lipoprotein [Fontimonas thermophila]